MKKEIRLIEDRFHLGYYFAEIKVNGTIFKTDSINKMAGWENKGFKVKSIKHWPY